MRKIKVFLVLIIGIAFFTSCSNKIYYTSDLNARVGEKNLSVNKIQFYLSKKIVLKRVRPHDTAEVMDGSIRFEKGKFIDQIIIKKNTPGVCEFVNNGFMFISFEDGHNKLLKFVPRSNGDYYELFIDESPDKFRTINYDTAQYIILPGADNARLWVRKDQDYILRITNRVVGGRTIDN